MTDKTRAHVIISGRVQGVFFRVETQRAAAGQGVTGWVRNKRDGRVEALLEGPRDKVEAVLAWCRKGSPGARVEDVAVDWQEFSGEFDSFEITH